MTIYRVFAARRQWAGGGLQPRRSPVIGSTATAASNAAGRPKPATRRPTISMNTKRCNRAPASWRGRDKKGNDMEESPIFPAAQRSGAATGAPSGDHTEFRKAAIQPGRG